MKSVLISIKPKWCELIASGKKTIEVRKTQPRLNTPFKVYIYCTQGKPTLGRYLENNSLKATPETDFDHYNRNTLFRANGKVIGEFVCDEITGGFWIAPFSDYLQRQSCLSYDEVCDYANGKPIFAWHISNLVIYDKPRELSEFVVEGDCLNGDCKKCKWFDGGNNYNVEADCLLPYNFNFNKTVKPLFRPPQSWCYVESEVLE